MILKKDLISEGLIMEKCGKSVITWNPSGRVHAQGQREALANAHHEIGRAQRIKGEGFIEDHLREAAES